MHVLSVGPTLIEILSSEAGHRSLRMNKCGYSLSDGSATHTKFVMFAVCTTGGADPALVLTCKLSFRSVTYNRGTEA